MKKFYFAFVLLIGFFCWSNLCIGWTVEYTDGSNNESYFETQRYSGVPDGHASPGYSGDPSREGYVFAGWFPKETNNVRSDITYVAQWRLDADEDGILDIEGGWIVEYTDGSDDELYFHTQRYSGVPDGHASPGYSGNPRREGYVFVGWSPEETNNVRSDITYVAQWRLDADEDGIPDIEGGWIVEYTDGSNNELYFHTQRYSGVPDGHASPGYSGDPRREGYVFVGWSPEETNNVRSDITYVAQWKPDTNGDGIPDIEGGWTVEYTDGSNNESYFKTQRYSGVPDGHASPGYSGDPRREGYVFIGWSPEETNNVRSDITYVAQWKPDTNGDGIPDIEGWIVEYTDGSNNESYFETQRYSGVPDGQASPGYSGDPRREGYVFIGWSPKETNSVRSDITYVAQWKEDADGDGIPDGKDSSNAAGYNDEYNNAYQFAYKNEITTKNTIESANMNGNLTRIAMAKMLSQYAINVLGMKPDETKQIKFNDVSDELDVQYDNGVILAYQLGIMGINMPKNNFRPNDSVTRAEFATALSRMLYGIDDGVDRYYSTHLSKLQSEGIITNIDPTMQEKRGYVMIMLMRSVD